MTDKYISMIRNFIVIQQNHWAIYSIAYFVFVVAAKRYGLAGSSVGMWFLAGVFPVIFYWVRTASNNFFLFWSVHAASVLFWLLLPAPNVICRAVFVSCITFYAVSSVYFRCANKSSNEIRVSIFVPFGVTLLVLLLPDYVVSLDKQPFLHLLIVNLFFFGIATYVDRYTRFLQMNRHSVGYIPAKSIFLSGLSMVGSFLAVAAAVLTMIANAGRINELGVYIKKQLLKLLKFILSPLQGGMGEQTEPVQEAEEQLQEKLLETIIEEKPETSIIWDILIFIFFGVVLLVLLYNIVKLVFYLLNLLKLPDVAVPQEEESEDIREKRDIVEKLYKRKRVNLFGILSPAERIRRRYRRRTSAGRSIITAKGKKDNLALYTARECAEMLSAPEMGTIYEKARYSPYECTDEDVKEMKIACKGVKNDR